MEEIKQEISNNIIKYVSILSAFNGRDKRDVGIELFLTEVIVSFKTLREKIEDIEFRMNKEDR